MDLEKEVFTTFEAASLCHANISSIKNWIAEGRLAAFRTPGGHYRIKREHLSRFLDRHDIPNPLSAQKRQLLFVIPDDRLAKHISKKAREAECIRAGSLFEALLELGCSQPTWFLLSDRPHHADAHLALKAVLAHPLLKHTRLILLQHSGPQELGPLGDSVVLVSPGRTMRATAKRVVQALKSTPGALP